MGYIPISPVHSNGLGAVEQIHLNEDDAETFRIGVPCYLDGDGNVQEISATWGSSEICAGISAEAAHNLTTAATAEEQNEGDPIGMASAVTTAVGARPKSGKIHLYKANPRNLWRASLKSGQTFAASMVGTTRYALQKDATTGFWYVDNTDSGTSAKHAAVVERVDPNDTTKVYFKFNSATVLYS